MKAVTWNVEWATPRSRRTTEILSRIDRHAPEVICFTETDVGLLSQRGYTICSQPDAGYKIKMSRRKVILWSRELGTKSMTRGSIQYHRVGSWLE